MNLIKKIAAGLIAFASVYSDAQSSVPTTSIDLNSRSSAKGKNLV